MRGKGRILIALRNAESVILGHVRGSSQNLTVRCQFAWNGVDLGMVAVTSAWHRKKIAVSFIESVKHSQRGGFVIGSWFTGSINATSWPPMHEKLKWEAIPYVNDKSVTVIGGVTLTALGSANDNTNGSN